MQACLLSSFTPSAWITFLGAVGPLTTSPLPQQSFLCKLLSQLSASHCDIGHTSSGVPPPKMDPKL